MKITIVKKDKRNKLVCTRDDSSTTMEDLGPSYPYHDIAHFVIESTLKIKRGFYGNILDGYSIQELSDKTVIKTLPPESTVSEILTRALQSLHSGSYTFEQCMPLVHEEIKALNLDYIVNCSNDTLENMLRTYKNYIEKWNALAEGEKIEFIFTL